MGVSEHQTRQAPLGMEAETPVIDHTAMDMNESEHIDEDELEDIADVDEDMANELGSEEKAKEPEPEVGMMFETVAELLHYYVKYGNEKGFPVKKRSSRKGDDGEVRWVVFACARSGKTESTSTKAFKMHLITKTNCKAKINSALCPDGKWRITSVVLDHNHSLSPGESRYYKKNRIMRSFVKRNLEITDMADIGPNKDHDSFVVEANGNNTSTVNSIVEHTKNLSPSIDTKKKKLRLPEELVSHNVTAPEAQDAWGRALVKRAVGLVKSGMAISLGTGSTASLAIEELGRLIEQGKLKDIAVVGANYQSRILSRQFGVKTVDLNDIDDIDIAFDGVDEVDFNKNLLKGGGAAHTMQKVVDSFAKQCVILADQSKVVLQLGTTFPVPVEVLPAAISPVLRRLVTLGGVPEIRSALRKDGPVISDLGNMIVDVRFPNGIQNPANLEKSINMIPGVVENGIVSGIATSVLVAVQDGDTITVMDLEDFRKTIDVPSNANSLT